MGVEQGHQATDKVIIFSRGFRGGAMLVRSEWVMEMMRATPGPWTQLEFVVVGDQLPFGIAALVDLFVSEVGALVGWIQRRVRLRFERADVAFGACVGKSSFTDVIEESYEGRPVLV